VKIKEGETGNKETGNVKGQDNTEEQVGRAIGAILEFLLSKTAHSCQHTCLIYKHFTCLCLCMCVYGRQQHFLRLEKMSPAWQSGLERHGNGEYDHLGAA